MEVNDALIDNLANLACLEFNAEEKEEIKKDLQRMITFVEKLNELDTTDIAPILQMSTEVNVLREDIINDSISRETALKNAPSSDEFYFKVPKVFKHPSE